MSGPLSPILGGCRNPGAQRFQQLLGLTNPDSERSGALELASERTAGWGCPNTFPHPYRWFSNPGTPLAEMLYADLQ